MFRVGVRKNKQVLDRVHKAGRRKCSFLRGRRHVEFGSLLDAGNSDVYGRSEDLKSKMQPPAEACTDGSSAASSTVDLL